jgi:hypothetical protein
MKNKILGPLSITALFILLNAVTVSAQVCPSKSNAPWELWISKVQLNTLDNASDKFKDYNTLGYSDFTNLSATLTKGQSYPLTITAGLSWSGVLNNAYYRAWIDWNGDNTFQNSELVAASSSTNPFIGYVRVPDNVTVGDKRMRIAVKLGEFPTVCENFAGGEVEDYTVTVAEPTQTTGYDLIVLNLTVPPRLTLNVIDTIRFDIKNIGGVSSPGSYVSVFISSTNNQPSGDFVFYTGLTLDDLAPNASRTYAAPVRVPTTWTSETAYSVVTILSSANEINASNNTATAPSNVFLRPLTTCANQISVKNTVLCYDNANPNAIKINVAEGDTVFQKIVNKNGQVLSTSQFGNFKKDSVFVVNNQVIKKLANGAIAYTKTITPSVLSRYPKINLALEMSDGTFVLAGLQKNVDWIYPPSNRDSLVLITTDAQLNYQQSEVVFQNSGAYEPPYNGVLELMNLPNNQFVLMYYVGRSGSIGQSILNITTYQKNNAQLQLIKSSENGSYLVEKPILSSACGNNLVFKNYGTSSESSKGGTSGGISSSIFNLDSMRYLTSKSTSSSYGIGGSSTSYSYAANPSLGANTTQISANYGYDTLTRSQNFGELFIYFYNANQQLTFRKKIPFVPYEHIIRTGDTTCLIIVKRNERTFVFNPDCVGTPPNLPDLTISNINMSDSSVQIGEILYFSFDAKNIGTANVPNSFTIKSYLSTDRILDANDYQNGVINTANYPAGTTISQIQGAMRVNAPVFPYNFYLILTIDANNQVDENDEFNNIVVSTNKIEVLSYLNPSCSYQDSVQLVRLYNATNGANWTRKWNLSTPIRTWYGLTFSQSGCLEKIALSGNNLVGTIPDSLNFTNLTHLLLSDNQLIGSIPNFDQPTLTLLDLNRNNLIGSIPNFNKTNLSRLQLGFNQLSGTVPNFNLPNLSELYLFNNRLTGLIPNFNLPLLAFMRLDNNQLSGNLPTFNFVNLVYLYLNNNQLSGCIPLSYKRFCRLTVNIQNNPNLETQDFNAFCTNNTGACAGGVNTNDIALTISGDPSVYRPYSTQKFTITAKNNGTQAFTDVKIDFPYPTKTVNGGNITPSVGTWQEWCSGGIQCYTWTIPNLAANTTATLEIPVYVLDAVGTMTATTHLLSSNPVDSNASNNVATVLVNRAGSPPIQPFVQSKDKQATVLSQRLHPTLVEHFIVVDVESNEAQQIDFQIINALGTVVQTEKMTIERGNNKRQFDVSQLPKGLYLIQTSVGQGRNVPMKFVKY